MSVVSEMLGKIELPKMVLVQQTFDRYCVENLESEIRRSLSEKQAERKLKPGMKVAITAGSRGIRNIDNIIKILVDFVREKGVQPFIIPAMGSHGGATAEGQRKVLEELGITEKNMGCPIYASMKAVKIGTTSTGKAVFLDSYAAKADGIIVVNRVKAHTSFTGRYESGLLKMMAVGMGKQIGAQACHSEGHGKMAEFVECYGKGVLEHADILFGVAILENAYDETRRVEVLRKEEFIEREPQLLSEAKKHMPRIYISDIDVLIVDRMGKDISGLGMDPHVTGCFATIYAKGPKRPGRLAVLDLTEETHGNANGIGVADLTTRRLIEKIDFESTYANALTATLPQAARLPVVLENQKKAIQAAVQASGNAGKEDIRVVRIQDTLHLEKIWVSESLTDEVQKSPQMDILEPGSPFLFDEAGNLF